MNEAELYGKLGELTRQKDRWKESIPFVSSLLCHESIRVKAKAIWLLGEFGLKFPLDVKDSVSVIASCLESPEPLLRERAVNALGRIGRGSFPLIEKYWENMFNLAEDEDAKVRMTFIWASENIATAAPDIYENRMDVFEKLLHDENDRVRMEAPEIFRVIGKRKPEFVKPYVKVLEKMAESDENRVVRIHCLGALKASGIRLKED